MDDQQKTLSMGNPSLTSSSKTKEKRVNTNERRERRNFSREEESYLCRGIERFGPSWNSILWAYPFQPGRTNVDLAKKYKRLQAKAQGMDSDSMRS
ncbi:telomere repeats-binding bouquet formation protein 1-like isoform X2 [Oncorhynchus clarkii lewisi]